MCSDIAQDFFRQYVQREFMFIWVEIVQLMEDEIETIHQRILAAILPIIFLVIMCLSIRLQILIGAEIDICTTLRKQKAYAGKIDV